MSVVNEDMQKERDNCCFSIQEMTEFIDGGPDKTRARKERGIYPHSYILIFYSHTGGGAL